MNSRLEKPVLDFQLQFYNTSRVQKSKVGFCSIVELNRIQGLLPWETSYILQQCS